MKRNCKLTLLLMVVVCLFSFTACGSIQDTSDADKGSEYSVNEDKTDISEDMAARDDIDTNEDTATGEDIVANENTQASTEIKCWEDTLYLDTYQTSSKDGNYVATIDGKKMRERGYRTSCTYYPIYTIQDNGISVRLYMQKTDFEVKYDFIWPDLYGCSDNEWSIDTYLKIVQELLEATEPDEYIESDEVFSQIVKITEKESYTDKEGRVWRIFEENYFEKHDERMKTVFYALIEPGIGNIFRVTFDGPTTRKEYVKFLENDYFELSW